MIILEIFKPTFFHVIIGVFLLIEAVLWSRIWIDKQNLLEFKNFPKNWSGVNENIRYGIMIPVDPIPGNIEMNKLIKKCNFKIYASFINGIVIVILVAFQSDLEMIFQPITDWFYSLDLGR